MVLTLAVTVATLGMVAHDLLLLPLAPWAPEILLPTALWYALLAWYRLSRSAAAYGVLVAWALLNLVGGGILTALPLPLLPFVPEQTVEHYVAHVIYTVTQLPIVWLLLRRSRGVAVA